jgi:Ca-activated chloride channel family protein
MLTSRNRLALLVVLAAALLQAAAPGAALARSDAASAGRTESPYFFVNSDAPGVDRLPLKDTHVDVRVVGVIADVTVTQLYRNEGARPIEARYVFPGSTRAAVHGMTVRLADRVLSAEIREKQQARIEYDAAKREGRTTALLEQQRENVFQMNVANIMPGDDVKVELRYTELVPPTDGKYQFVFPTVVGPRYNGRPETGSGRNEPWISTPYLHQGELSQTRFAIEVQLATPMPLQSVASPSHRIVVRHPSDAEAEVRLANDAGNENNRDFVLDYGLAGDRIASGMLLSRGGPSKDGENFFLAMVEPPLAVGAAQIVPREYIFIVDISGSMHGFPLDTAKALLQDLVGRLRPSDIFNVMLFAGSSQMLAPASVPALKPNIEKALQVLQNQRGGGGTELLPALRKALALPNDAERARTFVVVTDGYVSVEREAFELIRRNLSRANLFAFGIGSAVNRQLIEGMARAGGGEPFVVLNSRAAAGEAERFRRMIDAPVLTHLKTRFEGLDVYDVEPLSPPDVFAQRPVVIFGKWRGKPEGRLVLEGHAASGPFRADLKVRAGQISERNGALRYLWARQRVSALSDQEALEGGGGRRESILDLGLRYGLLTQYTSFIAVDRVVRNSAAAEAVSVDQPLPLPQGVSDLAVGAEVPSTPEPGAWWMLITALLGTIAWMRRRAAAA